MFLGTRRLVARTEYMMSHTWMCVYDTFTCNSHPIRHLFQLYRELLRAFAATQCIVRQTDMIFDEWSVEC